MNKLLPLLLLSSISFSFHAATRVATGSGNWEAPATWSGGSVPACGDSVVIGSGKVVTITSMLDYSGCSTRMAINISGQLDFQSGKKLDLSCGSQIYVQNGGSITSQSSGGGNANLITVCGSTAWNSSQGNVSGPVTVSQSGVQPVPVELVYFNARIEGANTIFNWSTSTETNNDHFEIQRSSSGNLFESIANISAAGSGTSLMTHSYSYIYNVSDDSYYRLKQVDKNGNCKVYGIVEAIASSGSHLAILPNPARNQLNISVGDDYLNSSVAIVNALGEHVFTTALSAYNNLVDISSLPAGLYYVTLENSSRQTSMKVMVQR